MDAPTTAPMVTPYSLANSPALIERLWPAQKLSAEAQKERKAGAGQTLTALGSYWKGRKPLILVRACVLSALLPATSKPQRDLEILEMLLGIDDQAFMRRMRISPSQVAQTLLDNGRTFADLASSIRIAVRGHETRKAADEDDLLSAVTTSKARWAPDARSEVVDALVLETICHTPYAQRVKVAQRPEETAHLPADEIWEVVNEHLGTSARSIEELVEQLGIMRFGQRPRVADTFAGGGSIPFESARIGCDVYASDLNPVACMQTWAAINLIGGAPDVRKTIREAQDAVERAVSEEIERLGIERDEKGNVAKAFLYCLETRCPSSGWLVPMLPSLVVTNSNNVVARLVPDSADKRYDIQIVSGVSTEELAAARTGTVQDGYLVHTVEGETHRTSIKSIRGDRRTTDGGSANSLRPWALTDVRPRPDDIFQERLYCVQWITADTIHAGRQRTYFASVNAADLAREELVATLVEQNLASWQSEGVVPDMPIEPGEKTNEPIRTRGWTYWHHLFAPRHLLIMAVASEKAKTLGTAGAILRAKLANVNSRLCMLNGSGGTSAALKVDHVFLNQAFNTLYNFGARSWALSTSQFRLTEYDRGQIKTNTRVQTHSAADLAEPAHIFITDPPYADAVNYHELMDFFIAWLRKSPPPPFDQWTWDSRHPLAIKGEGEDFRREMIAAYRAMTGHMPDNGLQIVMFTHQSGSVWADLAQIFWGAGLQVIAAWYIATETTSELKKGGYVQGTVILVLRKRTVAASGYEDEIVQDVRIEVARQIDTLVGLNQSLKGAGHIENVFEDPDLQMAGYAAALRVLTGYTKIDGRDMTSEALRPRRKGEQTFVDRMIEYAVAVANEHMIPEGLSARLWQQLKGPERFYLKMISTEAGGRSKLDDYQNFARAFRLHDYAPFMQSMQPNAARLKSAGEFGPRYGFDLRDFGNGIVRATLFAIDALMSEVNVETLLTQLRDIVPDYFKRRSDIIEVADFVANRRGRVEGEGRQASVLANLLRNERL
ncbi:MAG: DUF1156 domain-containing protein [Mesorhizobium sp.]|uniref:anti-phage-associated DUF1156 domain-containing protein n=1 Tax=Mesorhizobium sp. TaxID=1871066 RepID=UPI000FE5BD37|nr:anti-phage-associated DUF1156 domain-containing protein [Mesorhizobium sp.]RWC27000.1 MAG: DUF1156 domain-containing protein [Mesorhizobium sp.]